MRADMHRADPLCAGNDRLEILRQHPPDRDVRVEIQVGEREQLRVTDLHDASKNASALEALLRAETAGDLAR